MMTTHWCGAAGPVTGILDDPALSDPTPVPCKGPDCPKFDGGWCIHLLNGRTYEAVNTWQEPAVPGIPENAKNPQESLSRDPGLTV